MAPEAESGGDSAPEQPTLTVSEAAAARLRAAMEAHDNPVAGIRLAIAGRGPEGFQHSLALIEQGEEPEDDAVAEAAGITFYVEGRNVAYLNGLTIEYDGESGGGMLSFDNPNPLWRDEVSQRLQTLFDTQINPQIASHGGSVSLLGVDGSTAYIELGGGCVGCGMVDVTLKQGIEVSIKEIAPEIEAVVDNTDHASGSNPYYQPAKK